MGYSLLFLYKSQTNGTGLELIIYALKGHLTDFSYRVFVYRFDEGIKMYEIRLSRITDTAQNYFNYDTETKKYYEDSEDLVEHS